MSDDLKSNEDEKTGDEGENPSEEGQKGLPIKKILIIAIPLLLLIGGGAGAYFTGLLDGIFGKTPVEKHDPKDAPTAAEDGTEEENAEAAPSADEPAPAGEHGAPAAGEHGAAAAGTSQQFVKVADEKGQDLVVNLNSGDGQLRLLQLGVQLELVNPADAPKIKAVMPRVIDQFQTYLRELRVKDLRGSAGIYRLQIELLARVNQAAAPIKVKDVLFEKILIQ